MNALRGQATSILRSVRPPRSHALTAVLNKGGAVRRSGRAVEQSLSVQQGPQPQPRPVATAAPATRRRCPATGRAYPGLRLFHLLGLGVAGLFPWSQRDLVDHGGRLTADKLRPDAPCQSSHRHIVSRDQCSEPADTLLAGTLRQLSHQFGAESPALPFVHDGDSYFGGPCVLSGPDVTSDAQAASVGAIHCAERFMVVMVDLGEVAQLRRGQFVLRPKEPHLA